MLHNALKSVRKFHKMSVVDTAHKIGVSPSYISELENDKKRIHDDILQAYSRLFNMPVSSLYLIAEAEDEQTNSLKSKARRKVAQIIKWIASD